jgi:hypothetical protein
MWCAFVFDAVGVGSNPDAFSIVGSSGVVRSKHSPSRIKPHLGQVSENSSESSRSEYWAVFHEDESRSYFANNPPHLTPQSASLAVEPPPFPCGADVLARKAARNHVNNSLPWRSVEGANITPNGEWWKVPFILPLHKSSRAEGIGLHGADSFPAE